MKKIKIQDKKSNTINLEFENNKLYNILIILIIGFLPLIMRYYVYNARLSRFKWFLENDSVTDVFLYYKQMFFIFISGIMLLLLVYKIVIKKSKICFSYILIPLMIYILLAILSTILSKYPSYGVTGIYKQFESVFVIVGYGILVIFAYTFIHTEKDISFILEHWSKLVLVLGGIGVLQASGNDFFTSEIGKKLILPRANWDLVDTFQFKFGKYCSYLTLYNPNNVGVYVALVLPIFICLLITNKKSNNVVITILIIISLLISLYGSKSDSGYIGAMIGLLLIAIFLRNYIFKNKKLLIFFFGIIICICFFLIVNLNVTKHFYNIFKPIKKEVALTDIRTEKDIIITYNKNDLHVSYFKDDNNINLKAVDNDKKDLLLINDDKMNAYLINDKRFSEISVKIDTYNNILCVKILIKDREWLFTNQLGDGTYYYLNQCGRWDKIIKADSAIFTGYESYASGRGYIWSRTIPLLRKNILLGSGADTFSIVYPQQDYVNLFNYGYAGQIITKPHSLFLQIGVQTGVLSLIAFLLFYLMYFISSLKLYSNGNFNDLFSQVGVGIFIGTIGYMITGISNDSCIAVSSVFWGLIGIGLAVNKKVLINNKEKIVS